MLLREYAIEWWFIIPPLLTNVSVLPREVWTRKLSFQYATGVRLLLENVGGSEQNRSVIANVQSDDLWLSRMHAASRILQEKTHACGVLKRHNFRVHVSLGSTETLVRRGGIINHHSIAYSLNNISAKNYRNRLMWVESKVCNISVILVSFFETQCSSLAVLLLFTNNMSHGFSAIADLLVYPDFRRSEIETRPGSMLLLLLLLLTTGCSRKEPHKVVHIINLEPFSVKWSFLHQNVQQRLLCQRKIRSMHTLAILQTSVPDFTELSKLVN